MRTGIGMGLLLAAGLLAWGCGGDTTGEPAPEGSLGDPCHANGSCDATLVCVDELCALPALGCLGCPCEADGSCDATLVCGAGELCEPPPEGCLGCPCYSNDTCDATLVCVGDLCEPPPPDPCEGVSCSGHGACVVDATGIPACDCDEGYHAEGLDCVETPLTIGEQCFPAISTPGVPGIDYDQFSPIVGSHCMGTNHQAITGVERVVFVGDSVTVGVPDFFLGLGIGTPTAEFYRNQLADQLASHFGLDPPDLFWREVNLIDGVSLVQESGDFASCAKWGARIDDLVRDNTQLADCMPVSERSKVHLVILTAGGNDLASLTQDHIDGQTPVQTWAKAQEIVDLLAEAVAWVKEPGRFPNGVHLIFGNMYEFTDGTGEVGACPASGLAGFDVPPPDPALLTAQVIWIQEQYMAAAVAHGADMIWMLEHFCGHGFNNENPQARCYLGPGTERWFDLTCIHPNELGHDQLTDMFMAVVQE